MKFSEANAAENPSQPKATITSYNFCRIKSNGDIIEGSACKNDGKVTTLTPCGRKVACRIAGEAEKLTSSPCETGLPYSQASIETKEIVADCK